MIASDLPGVRTFHTMGQMDQAGQRQVEECYAWEQIGARPGGNAGAQSFRPAVLVVSTGGPSSDACADGSPVE